MRYLLSLILSLSLGSALSLAADWERIQTSDGQVLSLQGIGLNRTLNENFYLAAFYTSRPSTDAASFFDVTQARRLHLRILADRIYASGINRHFRDLILINNPRDELTRDSNTIQRFSSLFKLGLLHGDEVIIDYRAGKTTTINVNAVKVAEFSPRLFDFILRGMIGETPPGQLFKAQLIGGNNAERTLLLSQFDTTVVNEERLKAYASVEPAPVAPAQVAPAVLSASAPVKSIEKPIEKPAPVVEKPKPAVSTATKPIVADSKPASTPTAPAAAVEKPAVVAPNNKAEPVAAKAPPPPTAAQIDNWLAEYQAMVSDKFHTAVSYPKREMKRKYGISQMCRIKATITLRLFLDKGGDVNAAWLQKRSGETIIDQAALALVDTVAPFAPMRDELPDSAYEFFVELNYDPDA